MLSKGDWLAVALFLAFARAEADRTGWRGDSNDSDLALEEGSQGEHSTA